MGFQIESGDLSPYVAKVNSDGRLLVEAAIMDSVTRVAESTQLAFTWSAVTYSSGTGDTVLLIQNTAPNRHLHITRVAAASAVTTEVIVHFPDTITPTGTAVTGVNLNRTSGKTAQALAAADETANSQGDVLVRAILTANITGSFENQGAIILGEGDQIAVDFVTASTSATVTITGYYEDS